MKNVRAVIYNCQPTTFSGQLTRGTLSWYSAGGGTGVVSAGCCCVGFGLSLVATAAVESGTEALVAAPAAAVAGAAVWAAAVEIVTVVELGGLSLVEASPSPSTRLPTAGWDMFGILLPPRLPVLLRRSSAPSGLERVRGRSSTRRSSPSAGPGSGVSMDTQGAEEVECLLVAMQGICDYFSIYSAV